MDNVYAYITATGLLLINIITPVKGGELLDKIIVTGGNTIRGEVTISGAKNAVLPIIAGALLSKDITILHDVPNLSDVRIMKEILEVLGASVQFENHTMTIDCRNVSSVPAPYHYIQKMRASVQIMGPLLARFGKAKISMPGGCAIGTRPIDLHLKGLEALGASICIDHGDMDAVVNSGRLKGSRIYLDFPSVGATEHIMMAATLADGITIIENAAEEPEIVDLANFLNSMGAIVRGAGTKVIKIEGVAELHGTEYTIIPDRIEAGSYMIAAAITGGDLLVKNVIVDHVKPLLAKLEECGVQIREEDSNLRIIGPEVIRAADIKTLPYPGFPTDMQSQFMALMCVADGTSIFTETIFENRFMHADELRRMGANIKTDGRSAIVEGVSRLTGCKVKATDLRAGAALIIAALAADGQTEITELQHIDRGYENLIEKFQSIGADIVRIHEEDAAATV